VFSSDSSVISNLKITGAFRGVNFSRDKAAISGYHSSFVLNNVTINNSQAPVFVQYGNVSIKHCYLTSDVAGDLINIKYAKYALVENCELKGNDQFDSDGIDYDQIYNGIIRNNRIYNFYGFNSDAIDLGEGSKNILIENNIIYNIQDKGVSIGHGSTASIKRNIIANCDMGIGIKDFDSFGYVEHNTFYGNNYSIACYEKNIAAGGGNAEIINSIIANSKTASLFVDAISNIDVSYSLSNTDTLVGLYNTFAEPNFLNNLLLAAHSPGIDKGNPSLPADPDGSLPDLGAFPFDPDKQINLIINEIHYHPPIGSENEFIEIVNGGGTGINLYNFQLTGDIHFTFPGAMLSPGEYCLVAKNAVNYKGSGYQVFQWDEGALPESAGNILLFDNQGNLIDYVNYDSKYWWPREANGSGPSLELHHTSLENMTSSNWRISYQPGGSPGKSNNSAAINNIYINEFLASNTETNQDEYGESDDWIEIYNSNTYPVNLGGLFITDNLNRATKYQIPINNAEQTTIPGSGFLLFWTDAQPEQGTMHLNFKLDKTGEQIGLIQIVENDTIFIDSLSYIEQTTDISYGRIPDGSITWNSFSDPTPQDSNQFVTGITSQQERSLRYSLSQNYPNPFNPKTTFTYQLAEPSLVELSIYNLLGQKVATLISKKQPAGEYKIEWDASAFVSSVYFYRLETDKGFFQTRKLLFLK